MYELKKNLEKVLTSKSVGTGASSYEKKKRIYRAAVSQRLRNTGIRHNCKMQITREATNLG